jgi:glucose/arabinose dehydrogenase
VTVGDNAKGHNAQSLRNLKGKIVRINKDGTIPRDNPFYRRATGTNRAIWALGLRNPFSFAIQPHKGKMFINDVGEQTWEEIDRGPPERTTGGLDMKAPSRTLGT